MEVIVVPHDPKWFAKFSNEAINLRQALGMTVVAIHHIGSTSIAGIYAKPVIDVLLEVKAIEDADASRDAIAHLGYEVMGEFGISGRRYFRKNTQHGVREFQVHAFAAGSAHIDRHIALRDFMRAHGHFAAAYSELKRHLAHAHPNSIDDYMDGKAAFVKDMERRALQWWRPQ
jgi:GrpB-like predicted nucleotidyltransferase (UPF0157 family)